MRPVALFFVLIGYWCLLSGHLKNPQLWIAAVISALLTVWICRRMGIVDEEGQPLEGFDAWARYLPWLFLQIVKANVDVARIVWSPRLKIDPRLVEIPHPLRNTLGQTTLANSITLTPGTVTVAIDNERVIVHALTEKHARDLEEGEMIGRIKKAEE